MRLDSVIVFAIATVASIATVQFEFFERLHNLTKGKEHWEIDEFILVFIIWCLAAIVFAGIRGARLKAEVRIREAAEQQANTLARFDPLTGLHNRRLFLDDVDTARATRRPGKALAVLLIDLDQFKPINDNHGHEAGDWVLIEVAKRLTALASPYDGAMVARMGGDEFAVVLDFDAGTDVPIHFASEVITLIRMPIVTSWARVMVGASIGIAVDQGQSIETSELLRMADHAMYRAKESGRNLVRIFDLEMDAEVRALRTLEDELRAGIANGEMVPFYQPIARLADGGVSGFECLARWRHPTRGLLEADSFIAVAEGADLIDPLSLSLFERACADLARWPEPITLSFNISPVQLRNTWLPQQLLDVLARHGVDPTRLVLELTESGLFADIDVARTMIVALKEAGVKFALDDFGTGYSSLSHLSQLPFDIIKIDRSFIEGLDVDAQDSIVTAIIHMGHSLGMKVTAEGVCEEQNYRTLRRLGCDLAQGYLIGRPEGAAEAFRRIALEALAVPRLRFSAG